MQEDITGMPRQSVAFEHNNFILASETKTKDALAKVNDKSLQDVTQEETQLEKIAELEDEIEDLTD